MSRRHKGLQVNPDIPFPPSPGGWVDTENCVCGASYRAFRSGWTFGDAVNELAQEWRGLSDGCGGGAFISRGPVLTYWRAHKLSEWYMQHHGCGCYGFDLEALENMGGDLDLASELLEVTAGDVRRACAVVSAYQGGDRTKMEAARSYLESRLEPIPF